MNTPKEYELIEMIRVRPGMYLGSNSITALMTFLQGYQFALHEFRVFDDACRDNLFPLDFCFKFFELFDEFKKIRAERCWRAILSAENIAYNNSMEHGYALLGDEKQPIYDNPVCAYVIKLTIPAYLLAVETNAELRIERQFYHTFEHAVGYNHFRGSAEEYFGKIDGWTEVPDIDKFIYGKQILIR